MVFGWVFALSWASAVLIVVLGKTSFFCFRQTVDDRAVQRAHVFAAPRFGGMSILVGGVVGLLIAETLEDTVTDETIRQGGLLLLALGPVFFAGLLEDAGRHVPPRLRLAAAALSSLIAIALFGATVDRVNVPGLDAIIALPPIAVLMTIVAITGVSHAFNLIDGLNGLAGLTGLVTALGLIVFSISVGEMEIAAMAATLAAGVSGFLIVNYPRGRVFLGDAGAYGIGFVLAVLSVLLIARVPDITPWSLGLILFWPVADTCLAIWRRWRAGRRPDSPDRLHVHQLVMRAVEIAWLGRGRRDITNPLATALLLPLISMPIAVGVVLRSAPSGISIAAFAGFTILFTVFYLLGVRYASSARRPLSERPFNARPKGGEDVSA